MPFSTKKVFKIISLNDALRVFNNKIHINKKIYKKKMPNKEIRLKVRIDLIYE